MLQEPLHNNDRCLDINYGHHRHLPNTIIRKLRLSAVCGPTISKEKPYIYLQVARLIESQNRHYISPYNCFQIHRL
jgi:hypothetical protein